MRTLGIRIASVVVTLVALLAARGTRAQAVVAGTQYALFWRGDLRIIATRPNTQIDLIDVSTDGNHLDALIRFFKLREHRLRRT